MSVLIQHCKLTKSGLSPETKSQDNGTLTTKLRIPETSRLKERAVNHVFKEA